MKLNNYLKIKTATITFGNGLYLKTSDPPAYKAYRRLVPIGRAYNMLAESSGVFLPEVQLLPEVAAYTKNRKNKTWEDWDPRDFNGLKYEAFTRPTKEGLPQYYIASSMYMPQVLLHELGHAIDINKNQKLYDIVRRIPVLKRFNTIMRERGADAEARNFINKTIDTDPELRDRFLKEYDLLRDGPFGSQRNYYKNQIPIITGSALGAAGLGAGLGYAGYKGGDWLAKYFKLKNNGLGHNLLRYGGAIAGGLGGIYAGDIAGAYLGKKYVQNFHRKATEDAVNKQMQYYKDNYDEPGNWGDGSKPGTKLVQDLFSYAVDKFNNKPWDE